MSIPSFCRLSAALLLSLAAAAPAGAATPRAQPQRQLALVQVVQAPAGSFDGASFSALAVSEAAMALRAPTPPARQPADGIVDAWWSGTVRLQSVSGSVPEPATAVTLLLGILLLALRTLRRARRDRAE